MSSILTSALSLLFISSHLATVHAGNSKFYLDQQDCAGGPYVDFDIHEVHKCYSLTSGTAASFYTDKGNELDYVKVYRKDKSKNCGKEECSVKQAHACCSSKKKQITGLLERAGSQNCTSVDEIGEPFIVLGDGTHFGLGVGKLGKFSADELQDHLEANGKERLPAEHIANLIQLKVIRFLI
ncbi:hypothetical protein THARTR1_01291 [Trichoderma harzianum]|uniref:Uncharacterized protein n=1 Tax=Trichoderma harzianum TaxID=5544 RepID=A0A2K0UMN0_TRIHA|nr:hypothetical protein THARTR1_01291 [Trichoderma harzianum]